MKNKLIILFVLLSCTTISFSQNNKEMRNNLRKGNKEYRQEKYTESEIAYRKSLEANAKSPEAAYNLGNALFMQKKYPEAGEQYQAAIEYEKDKVKKSWSWHNTGNIFLQQAVEKRENPDQSYNENLQKSIDAFKNALRNNPKDDETRYNLALAQKLLKDNQDKGGGQDNKEDKKEEKKEEKKEDQKQDQKQDQKKDEKKDQQQQQQPQMSKENAQQILDAMMQNEKNTQERVKEQQMKAQQRKRTEKEW